MSRADFEAWARSHWGEDVDQFNKGDMKAMCLAYQAAERAAVRRCAELCEAVEDKEREANQRCCPEMQTPSETGAEFAKDAIRSAYPEHFEGE